MRISTRITVSMAAAGLAVFGTWGALMLRTERNDLRQAVAREVTLLGNSLRVSMENALRDRQLGDIEEVVGLMERVDASVSVFVYSADGRVLMANDDHRSDFLDGLAYQAMSEKTSPLHFTDGPAAAAVLAAPLLDDHGSLAGAVILHRPLTDITQDLTATTRGIALSVLIFVLAISALGALLGNLYISRPLRRMAAAMTSVRSGDLDVRPEVVTDDEMGAFAEEFTAMVAALGEARARLAREEEERRDLTEALQRVDKLVTIGQLSAALAHEIGSPLQVLQGRAWALLRRPDDPERTRRYGEILVRESERISRIVEGLLGITRRRPASPAPSHLPPLAQMVVDLLELEARRRSVRLEHDPPAELPRVVVDPDQFQQVVLNLVQNALAACSPGEEVRIRYQALFAHDPPSVVMLVEDDGAGMSEEVRQRAFEPFFSTRGAQGGTGLGLAVVQSLVRSHGGAVEIHAHEPKGTVVSVLLPMHDGPEPGAGGDP